MAGLNSRRSAKGRSTAVTHGDQVPTIALSMRCWSARVLLAVLAIRAGPELAFWPGLAKARVVGAGPVCHRERGAGPAAVGLLAGGPGRYLPGSTARPMGPEAPVMNFWLTSVPLSRARPIVPVTAGAFRVPCTYWLVQYRYPRTVALPDAGAAPAGEPTPTAASNRSRQRRPQDPPAIGALRRCRARRQAVLTCVAEVSAARRSAFSRGGFVLLDDTGGDPPALADLDVVFPGPRPDVGAVLAN
jgi:hypothetical protein